MSGKMDGFEIIKLLEILIGKTEATGDQAIDNERLKNLKTLIDVTNWCVDGIKQATETRHCYEKSLREIGQTAFSALDEYRIWIEEVLNHETD